MKRGLSDESPLVYDRRGSRGNGVKEEPEYPREAGSKIVSSFSGAFLFKTFGPWRGEGRDFMIRTVPPASFL